MAGRISLSGKKYGGKHSSYTKMAGELVRALEKYPEVKKISAGIIKTNLPNLRGSTRIKLISEGSCLLLRLRSNISLQEVRVFTSHESVVISRVRQYAQAKHIDITE